MSLVYTPEQIIARREAEGRLGLLAKYETWVRLPLAEIAKVTNGAPFKSDLFNREGKGLPLIRIRDVGEDSTETFYSGEYDRAHLVDTGAVLVGMDGDFRVAVWRGPEALLNQRVCRLDPLPDHLDPRLLVLMLQPYLDAIWEETSAVTVKHLSSKTINAIPLPIPPRNEQAEIVRILDTQLARLDIVLGAVQAVRDKADQFRRSLLHAAFTGQLTQPDPIRDGWPESWQSIELAELAENLDGKRIPIKAADREHMHGDFPYYGASGVIDHVDDFIFDGCFLLISEDGANLLARTKPIAFQATGRFWVNNHAHVLSANPGTDQTFLMHAIEQSDLSGLITGTAQPKLTQRNMNQMMIPTPPLDEQEEIVRILETQLARMNKTLEVADRVEVECGRLRRSLLQAAFAGELTKKWREANV